MRQLGVLARENRRYGAATAIEAAPQRPFLDTEPPLLSTPYLRLCPGRPTVLVLPCPVSLPIPECGRIVLGAGYPSEPCPSLRCMKALRIRMPTGRLPMPSVR